VNNIVLPDTLDSPMNPSLLLWPLVASRVVHSYIHIGSNYVPNRTRTFKLSLLFVVGLAALLLRALVA
jgi:hypothetical protein